MGMHVRRHMIELSSNELFTLMKLNILSDDSETIRNLLFSAGLRSPEGKNLLQLYFQGLRDRLQHVLDTYEKQILLGLPPNSGHEDCSKDALCRVLDHPIDYCLLVAFSYGVMVGISAGSLIVTKAQERERDTFASLLDEMFNTFNRINEDINKDEVRKQEADEEDDDDVAG